MSGELSNSEANWTDRAREVMRLAEVEARRLNHEYIGTEHMLLGLAAEGKGVGAVVLKSLETDFQRLRSEVEDIVAPLPPHVIKGDRLPLSPRARRVLDYAQEEAARLGHHYCGTEHILLGLARDSEGIAAMVFFRMGLKYEDLRDELLNVLGCEPDEEGY